MTVSQFPNTMNACGIKSFCRDKNVVIEVRIKYFQKKCFLFTIFSREGALNILSRSMLSTSHENFACGINIYNKK